MRRPAILAALAAAAALGGVAAPAAYADETVGDLRIDGVVVNGGKNIVVDTADKTVTVSVTATDPSGIWDADFYLWRGPDGTDPYYSADDYVVPDENTTPADRVASSSTTSTCSKTFTFEPDWWLTNADAGTWKVGVQVSANDGSRAERWAYTTTRLQRHSKLNVNAGPEPIAQGKTLTITGKLTRANWDTLDYRGYTFDRRRSTPCAARSFVADTLTRWGQTERLDDIRLCVSELATNAVLHGARPGGKVLVRVELRSTLLRIEVHDGGNGTPSVRAARSTADDGRGLLLVSALADHWGVEERQGPGKCGWAAFHHSAVRAC